MQIQEVDYLALSSCKQHEGGNERQDTRVIPTIHYRDEMLFAAMFTIPQLPIQLTSAAVGRHVSGTVLWPHAQGR
jgi:hypothetical protein